MDTETLDDAESRNRSGATPARPGLVLVYSHDRAACRVFPLVGGRITVGRDALAEAGLADARVSREHALVERADEAWSVRDLDSRNGTFVDGRRTATARASAPPVVRVGRSLFLAVDDCREFDLRGVVVRGGAVMGPSQQALHARIEASARVATTLMLLGGSGTGKELAARAFHAAARGVSRPFVAVNCAAIPHDIAERMLFGAVRGAYTGAVDAVGLVQAADGGTLFLDEIAELDPAVQAVLLRVLETRQVAPLGGVRAVPVDLCVCAATHRNVRAEVAAGRFREDLYFRIGRPELRLASLCERREEVPALIELALGGTQGASLRAGVEFVEACLLRPWPGNVRELLAEVRSAALTAVTAGRAVLAVDHLDDEAGRALQAGDEPASDRGVRTEPPLPEPERVAIDAALRAEQGNVARAAARLGLSRSRLRRIIEREAIDLAAMRAG